ncbi:MAG: DUF302 domain-containing protein [Actinobacteria bacterium]|nr:DUF302 domain-containing protein [Actinomycetota bacterium]
MTELGYQVQVLAPYDEAVIRARLAFRSEGFSVLSEMHVGGMLGPEAGDKRQYLIMGVWNAPVDQSEVTKDLTVGVHLPCNLVIEEDGEVSLVAALDPLDAMDPQEQIDQEVANKARAALARVLGKVSEEPAA